MPKKVYAIIHDGANVLVGAGGNSGKPPAPRKGHHFPGGTVDNGETAKSQVEKEIKQEIGFDLVAQNASFVVPGLANVSFIAVKVGSVNNDLVARFARPNVVNQFDEPFMQIEAVTIGDALNPGYFKAADWTDWFGQGLQHAQNQHLLI